MKFKVLLQCCALVGATLSSLATARDLTVVGFGGDTQEAFTAAYLQPYSQKTGKKIIQDSYTGGIAKLKAMVESRNVTWDLVQMDENEMAVACDDGLLEPLDRRKLSNAAEVEPSAFAKCGVGAFVWSKVLTYDPKRFGANGPKTWAEFWDVKKWPGKRGLRKQARMTLEIALLSDGVAPQDLYKVLSTRAGQDRAFARLDQIKQHIQWWESGAQPLEWLASGAVAATAAYNGRIAIAQRRGTNFPISWENQLYSMDYWTIPKGSANRDQALELLDYMLSAERQKAYTDVIPYGIVNKKAVALIKPDTLQKLPTAPNNMKGALLLDTQFWVNHEEELMERFTKWVAQ